MEANGAIKIGLHAATHKPEPQNKPMKDRVDAPTPDNDALIDFVLVIVKFFLLRLGVLNKDAFKLKKKLIFTQTHF